jgi:parallel beta-helix repeat protein
LGSDPCPPLHLLRPLRHTQTAINTAGNPDFTTHSNHLSVTNNVSVDDATFVVATNSQDSLVSHNQVSVTAATNGTAILDFGCNVNLSIDHNMISGGASTGSSGINVRNLCGAPSVNTMVTNNDVSNRYNGIRVTGDGAVTPGTGATGATISGNDITGSSNDGIFMELGTNNSFQHNQVAASSAHDCEDITHGTGTAGTANQWIGNSGTSNNSSPPAICPSH